MDAFSERYRSVIVQMARRWVQAEDAEDVAQEVLCYIHQFGQRVSLRLLVRNFCVEALRRAAREAEAMAAHQAAEAGMVRLQGQHLVDMADTTTNLAKVITDPVERVTVAGILNGKSEREMAKELGVGQSTIRRRKKKIKNKLMK